MNVKVSIQGFKGAYSEEAAWKMLKGGFEVLSFQTFEESFDCVLCGAADYGVFPIWNKLIGKIERVTFLLERTKLKVHDQRRLRIEHVLIGTPNSRLRKIRYVYSQREALLQCRNFFLMNPQLKQVESQDTALSVQEIVTNNLHESAAIASRRAAEIHGGKVLCEGIADDPENWTLFCLVGR